MADVDGSALQQYELVRQRSLALAAPLSEEDCAAQSMPEASPVKWHLAHTTWFFETFVLEPHEDGFAPFHPAFRMLFNSYYNGVGERHPRARRGLLTRPSLCEVRAYRDQVDARMGRLLEARGAERTLGALVLLGLQHEQQHQELMLTDVKHLLAQSPLYPAYLGTPEQPWADPAPLGFEAFPGGLVQIGHGGEDFCFDNELPRHRQYLAPFKLARRLVTNAEYLAFIEAGGYRQAQWWLAEGWDRIVEGKWEHPLYWVAAEGTRVWHEFTLHGLGPLDLNAPVRHLSLYEADACARFMGARLPTEAEWEVAAGTAALQDMYDCVWQWTSSSYAPYPGYACAAGALGEYNGKFMLNQYVLRGSSGATAPGHARASYRNFFPAGTRWQFAGLRLAQ